ncbi:MAG: NAD-dependent epimerase/dehydratase family protein [Vicinamibacteria bacterium]|nr:NAD-dependent epimerase/dehydratase family protein [Vicinamibacteria bacterium]
MQSEGKTFRRIDKVLVTGGAGFIGSALVKRLVREGARVRVIDNLWRGRKENLRGDNGRFIIDVERDFDQADLADMHACRSLVRDVDLVYHLADVVSGVGFAFKEEPFIFHKNILINTGVLNACVENQVPRYVYVGTACSYPKCLQMADGVSALREEQTYPAEPESSYGWSKLMGEYEATLAQRSGRIEVGLLRLHNVYGPGASYEPERSQVIPALIRKALLYPAEPFVVWGSGDQYRDFIYIDDVVEALRLVVDRGMNKGLIQIGSERPTSVRELAETIAAASGKPITPVFDESRPQGDRGRIAVCDRAREILGWRPRTDLRSGIETTYRWIQRRIEEPPTAEETGSIA